MAAPRKARVTLVEDAMMRAAPQAEGRFARPLRLAGAACHAGNAMWWAAFSVQEQASLAAGGSRANLRPRAGRFGTRLVRVVAATLAARPHARRGPRLESSFRDDLAVMQGSAMPSSALAR